MLAVFEGSYIASLSNLEDKSHAIHTFIEIKILRM